MDYHHGGHPAESSTSTSLSTGGGWQHQQQSTSSSSTPQIVEIVEVLYSYETKSHSGKSVHVRPGERYCLLADKDDSWAYVSRLQQKAQQQDNNNDGFYLPKTYIQPVVNNDGNSTTSFKPDPSNSASSIDRRSLLYSSPSSNDSSLNRRGFKLADPKRVSRVIAVDTPLITHNINDLAAQQSAIERMRDRDPDHEGSDEQPFLQTAIPLNRHSSYNHAIGNPLQDSADDLDTFGVGGASSSVYESISDERKYENLESYWSTERPPVPEPDKVPNRLMDGGWAEFVDPVGRLYFYHKSSNTSTWKPPRAMRAPEDVAELLESSTGDGYENNRWTQSIHSSSNNNNNTGNNGHINNNNQQGKMGDEGYSSQMTCSADSNSSKSLTLNNRGFGMQANTSDYDHSMDVVNVLEGDDGAVSDLPPSPSHNDPAGGINPQQKSIKCGNINRCKYYEAGKKQKKQWSIVYIYLTGAHIIIYKDEKASEAKAYSGSSKNQAKRNNHYGAPLGVCDLRGAHICWKDEKELRKRHVFQLNLFNQDSYLMAAQDTAETNAWFHAIRTVIASLPPPDPYPLPRTEDHHTRGQVSRRGSASLRQTGSMRVLHPQSSPPTSPTSKKSTKHDKRRSAQMASGSSPTLELDATESRDSIIEKLRKLFKSRPSIDTLKDKGIYKRYSSRPQLQIVSSLTWIRCSSGENEFKAFRLAEPVFGSSILEICHREQTSIPKFIRICTETIEKKGLDVDGIYRISGNLSQIQKIRCQVDQDKYNLLESEEDIHVLSGALKLFFRELQEPLFPFNSTKDFLNAINVPNGKQKCRRFQEHLKNLPLPHRDTLKLLLGHLIKVSEHSKANRMQIHNLAIVFGPTLFSSGEQNPAASGGGGKGKSDKKDKKWKNAGKSQQSTNPEDFVATSNSHLAFKMIMQGQILEYLLKEFQRLFPPPMSSP